MSASRYQLPVGTYRELLNDNRITNSFMDVRPVVLELAELRRSATEDDAEVERLVRAVRQAIGQAKEEAAESADQMSGAGKPIVALVWQVARHVAHPFADAPSWLSSASATVRVFADDTCEQVSS